MKRLLTVMVLCVFASFAHADEQNAIQPPQGVEICKEPLSDNCKAFGDRINQRTPEKQKAYVEERKLTGIFTFDRSSAAMKAFAVPHTSYIVVVGTDRRVAYTGVGVDQDIDAVLAKLGTP